MKILLVGGGNMGKIYADSFIAHHSVKKDDLYILEHYEEKANYFKSVGFHHVFFEAGNYISEMDLIIFAVKPQDSQEAFQAVAPFVASSQVVMSIMAGVKIQAIRNALPTDKIVRVMPNLPAQVRMGMSGFTSSNEVSKEELFSIHNLLNTTGKSLYFDDESKLDAVTAISGSGPAYVYYFMDAMMNKAAEMGFTKEQAELLVEQTFLGAVHLQNIRSLSCQEWIQKVASKGGTTEAAIRRFADVELDKHISEGLEAAHQRAIELGN